MSSPSLYNMVALDAHFCRLVALQDLLAVMLGHLYQLIAHLHWTAIYAELSWQTIAQLPLLPQFKTHKKMSMQLMWGKQQCFHSIKFNLII